MMVVCFERNYTMLIHWGSKIIKFNRHALEQRISASPLPNWLIKNIVPCSCCLRKVLWGNFLSFNSAINFLRTSVMGVRHDLLMSLDIMLLFSLKSFCFSRIICSAARFEKRRDAHKYWFNAKSHETDQETKNKTIEITEFTCDFNYVSNNDLLLTGSQLVY